MEFIQRSELSTSEKQEVLQIWNQEYPKQIAYTSVEAFEEYLYKHSEQWHLLLINEKGKVMAWYFHFKREGEKWLALLLDAKVQGMGYGSKMLDLAKEKETVLNAWVIDHDNDIKQNGEAYRSPLNFYLKNGFKVLDSSRLELEMISAVKLRWERS